MVAARWRPVRALLRPIRQFPAALAERRAGRAGVAFQEVGASELYDIVTDVRATLDTALQLARAGDWARLGDWCDDLAAGDPGLAPFATLVRARLAVGGAGLTDWLGARPRHC